MSPPLTVTVIAVLGLVRKRPHVPETGQSLGVSFIQQDQQELKQNRAEEIKTTTKEAHVPVVTPTSCYFCEQAIFPMTMCGFVGIYMTMTSFFGKKVFCLSLRLPNFTVVYFLKKKK